MMATSGDRLLQEALEIPFRGWDFSVLGDRLVVEPPSWSFEQIVDDEASRSASMLDMGTGGGEWLSSRRLPVGTIATESWPPNVAIAAARLGPSGIPVVHDEGATDNADQATSEPRGRLAFRDAAFDLVVSRHEAYVANEVRRVLRDRGAFVTQQARSGAPQFHDLLALETPPTDDFHLDLAVEQLQGAGLRVEQSAIGAVTTVFADIGALAWYLSNVPWVSATSRSYVTERRYCACTAAPFESPPNGSGSERSHRQGNRPLELPRLCPHCVLGRWSVLATPIA